MKEDNKNKSKTSQENNFQLLKDKEARKRKWKEAKEEGKHQEDKNLQASVKNLIPLNERSPEEQKAIRQKAAEATNKIKGEKKTAKQILDNLLPLFANVDAIVSNECIPVDIKKQIIDKKVDITQYDLIMLAQIYQAQQGNTKAAEFIANHNGDIVTKEVNINEGISEADKLLINKIKSRLNISTGSGSEEN